MTYTVEKDRLFYDGRHIYTAPAKIRNTLTNDFNDSVVIVYDPRRYMPEGDYPMGFPPKTDSPELQELINQNVLCIDKNGNLLWRIEPTFEYPIEFTMVANKEDTLLAARLDGYECHLDPRTGKVLEYRYVR